MAVRVETPDFVQVDYGRDETGGNVIVPFPRIYRYDQSIAEVEGYDSMETGGIVRMVHYGYSPHPVIRINNLISSTATPISRLDLDLDGEIWLLCHRHRSEMERMAYAHALQMSRDPSGGLFPAAIEYVVDDMHYTIHARRPPLGAPAGMIAYGETRTSSHHSRIMTVSVDSYGRLAAVEPYLFPFIPLPNASSGPGL